MGDFGYGEYVIADRAIRDTYTDTFKVLGFLYDVAGNELVQVVRVNDSRPLGERAVLLFYPEELSYMDGSRP